MKAFLVWGEGAAEHELIRTAETVTDQELYSLAAKRGRNPGADGWLAMVDSDDDAIDAATRYDGAVIGYGAVELIGPEWCWASGGAS